MPNIRFTTLHLPQRTCITRTFPPDFTFYLSQFLLNPTPINTIVSLFQRLSLASNQQAFSISLLNPYSLIAIVPFCVSVSRNFLFQQTSSISTAYCSISTVYYILKISSSLFTILYPTQKPVFHGLLLSLSTSCRYWMSKNNIF